MNKQYPYWLFPLVLVLYETTTYFSNDMFLPALPQLTQEFQIDAQAVMLTLTSWFIGTMSLYLILGPIADRFGRRKVLLTGGVSYIMASIVCSLTTDFSILLLARFFQGAAVCSLLVSGYATFHDLFSQQKAISMLTWMNSIIIVAPSCGPLSGGLILQFVDWRWIFYASAAAVSLVLAILWFIMPETAPKKQQNSMFKQTFKVYSVLLRTPQYMLFTLAISIVYSTLISWLVAGPFILIDEFHYSKIDYGLYQMLMFGLFIVGMQLSRRLMQTKDVTVMVRVGFCLVFLASIAAVIGVVLWPQTLNLFIGSFAVFFFGVGLLYSPMQRIALETSTQPMGPRVALYWFCFTTCGALATVLVRATYHGQLLNYAWLVLGFGFGSIACMSLAKWHRRYILRRQAIVEIRME